MNLERLKEELIIDEGVKHELYLDHLGLLTFGVGHLVTENDPEYGGSVGDKVSESRVDECFIKDIGTVVIDCKRLYQEFEELPEEVQLILANMMFNMGFPRLSKFKNMNKAILDGDWNKAADEMIDSRWYRQVTNRADRLVNRMRSI